MNMNLLCGAKYSYRAVVFFVICMLIFASMSTETNGFSMKLMPRNSIDSTLFPKNISAEEMHYKIVQLSQLRALQLRSTSLSNHTPNTLNYNLSAFIAPIGRGPANLYVVKLSIGSNLYSPYLLLDTSFDDTWVQCQACTTCFPLKGGGFEHHKSQTFQACTCYHPLCSPQNCSISDVCSYNLTYTGGSITSGIYGEDTLSFPTNGSNATIKLPNVVFGCGLDNINITFGGQMGSENEIAGVFGLGLGRRSILQQLEYHTQLRFSYCLPSWTGTFGTHTWFRVGDDAQISGDSERKVYTVDLISRLNKYYVYVSGITFANTLLPINPSTFKQKSDGTGGFIIDSSVGPTLLVKEAYEVLKYQVVQYFSRYGWVPESGKKTPYDICYKFSLPNATLPSMNINFKGGAQLLLSPDNVFQRVDKLLCLIFMPTYLDGVNLLGAFQQANHRFLFDVKASKLSFVVEKCQDNS